MIQEIKDLMVGVHLAGMAEAMSFCEHLGLDVDLMFDVVSNAAGASSVFVKYFEDMKRGGWTLKAVPEAGRIRDAMVGSHPGMIHCC